MPSWQWRHKPQGSGTAATSGRASGRGATLSKRAVHLRPRPTPPLGAPPLPAPTHTHPPTHRWQDGEYTVAQLRAAFAAHGVVEDVVLREGKKRKGSALVVMASREGAASAAASACGDLANPLLVVPFPKVRAERGWGAARRALGRQVPRSRRAACAGPCGYMRPEGIGKLAGLPRTGCKSVC